jgi:tryptophanyl-tRNA synthetase
VHAFERATDPTQKQQIEEQVTVNIKTSLAQGLSPQRYNQIFIQVSSNELLRKRALKQIEEERKKY